MKLTISKNANVNYLAKIVHVETFSPHPNADKLKLAGVGGCITACSNTTKPGIFIYFPIECCISEAYLKQNNLYRDKALNSNPEVNPGFFEPNGRVKCVRLRGFVSEGLIMPIDTLTNDNCDDLVGTEFDEVDGIKLVEKYVIAKHRGGNYKQLRDLKVKAYEELIVDKQFRFHSDTEQLKKNLYKFNPDTLIQISDKRHGTSSISCKLLTKRKLSLFERIARQFGAHITDYEYSSFCSSRKVIKDPRLNPKLGQNYYDADIWNIAHKIVEPFLVTGQTLYFEIIGYLPTGNMIQKDYDYGCTFISSAYYKEMTPIQMWQAKLFDIYIYRSTYTNIDGKVFEMSSKALQEWCTNNGLPCVQEYFYGTVDQLLAYHNDSYQEGLSTETYQEHFLNVLIKNYLEKDDPICRNKVPQEGIVIRLVKNEFEAYKLKSLRFLEKESKQLDSGEVDLESSQDKLNE